MALRINTLGTLRVERDGQVLDRLPARRVRCALLVYLAVEREATRDRIMGLLWPDRPPERARHLLSQTLYELRQDLGDDPIHSSGEQLSIDDAVSVDVLELEAAVEAGHHTEAVALYGGPFLPGGSLAVSREVEGWTDAQQAKITRLHRRARRGAIDELVERGALQDALTLARSWADLDPLDDEAQHRLIELMSATGDRSGALRQYDRYAALVGRELELEPLDETRELVERMRQGDVGQRPAAPVVPGGQPPTPEAATPAPTPPPSTARSARRDQQEPSRRPPRRSALRWTLIYLVASVAMLEATARLAAPLSWPPVVPRLTTLLIGLGAAAVIGLAWAESFRLRRRLGRLEAVLITVVVIFAAAAATTSRQPSATLVAAEPDEMATSAERLDPRRIAVLYLDDLSPGQDLRPLAAGFTEALIHELGQVDGLDVLSRTAVAPYRDRLPPHDSLVTALRAGTLVTGSVTRLEDRIRVMVQLEDGADASHIASQALDRPPDSLTQLLEALPREVARMLRRRLGPEIELRETRAATTSAEAWELVQRAQLVTENERAVMREDFKEAEDLLLRADSMLERAEALDPEWLEPVVRRARVAGLRAKLRPVQAGTMDPELARQAIGHADRALETSPEHPPALEERGRLLLELAESLGERQEAEARRLYQQAESDLRAAVELAPERAEAWWSLSKLLRRKGAFAEAKQAARRALDADAFLVIPANNLFQLFHTAFTLEEHREAADWCRELHRRHPKHMRWVQCELMLLASSPPVAPEPERAWALVDSLVDLSPDGDAAIMREWATLYVAKALTRAGHADSARAVVARLLPDPAPTWTAYDLAHLHLMMGDEERSLELLEMYARANPGQAGSLADDWWFRPLHGHPRLERIAPSAMEADGTR